MQLKKSKEDKSQRSIENSAKTLLANIRFMSVDDPVRTVVITSSIPNEGKTFVATNLARAMATSGIRTLLVECDMRRRSLASSLGVHPEHGIYSVLSGEMDLLDVVEPTKTRRLYFLDSEPHIPNPSDILSSRRFASLIEEAKKDFGYIVFDTPPVGTFVDAAVLGAQVDALFMVVREQFTRKDVVARAADQLRTANVPLSGVVMNFCGSGHSSEYYYDYYYYYSDDKGKGKRKGSGSTRPPRADAGDLPLNMPLNTPLQSSDEARGATRDWSNEAAQPAKAAQPAHAAQPAQASRNWSNAPDLD